MPSVVQVVVTQEGDEYSSDSWRSMDDPPVTSAHGSRRPWWPRARSTARRNRSDRQRSRTARSSPGGYIGQWDDHTWTVREEVVPPRPGEEPPAGTPPRTRTVMEYTGLVPGYLKPSPVAWFASHRHAPRRHNEPYAYSYLFAYAFDVAPGASTLTLPNDDQLRVLAVTVTDEGPALAPADPDGPARLP